MHEIQSERDYHLLPFSFAGVPNFERDICGNGIYAANYRRQINYLGPLCIAVVHMLGYICRAQDTRSRAKFELE